MEQKDEVKVVGNENPVKELVTKYKEYQTFFDKWVDKQSLPESGTIIGATSAIQASSIAVFANILCHGAIPDLSAEGSFLKNPLPASCFAVWWGVDSCIYHVMKKSRGVEDIWTSMVAGFGSGAAMSLVFSGARGAKLIPDMGFTGVVFALLHGGAFKLKECYEGRKDRAITGTIQKDVEDLAYNRTKGMLSILGFDNYEKNFKKGKLTDETLPLLTESNLQEVKIPIGPRLVILDYIKRNEIERKKGGLKAKE